MTELYDSLTNQLNNLVSSSSTAWTEISGGLDKVSSSSIGFAWGIGSGKAWVCQLPCSGNWKEIEVPGTPLDVTTDDSHVYVLIAAKDGNVQLAIKSGNNIDDWLLIKAPRGIQKIVSTASYIWAQAGSQKFKLPKPGTTGNWIPVKDPENIKVTSASSTSLYGIDASGNPMKTDETLQSGWTSIPQLAGSKYGLVMGDADQTAIYGLDTQQRLKRCPTIGECTDVSTNGFTPQNLTIEPISKQLWMTTSTTGTSGNIFMKPDSADYSQILQTVQPVDKERDAVVSDIEQEYVEGTHSNIMSKQVDTVKEILGKFFNINPSAKKKSDAHQKNLRKRIQENSTQIDQFNKSIPVIQDILIILAILIMIYMLSGVFGVFTHVLALLALIGGVLYFIYYKKK